MSRAAASTGLALVLAAVTAAASGAVSAPQQILAGPEDQTNPSVNDTYLIWTQNSTTSSNRYHAHGRALGTTDAFRLNPTGTRGFAGGIDPDQDRAIYQQIDGQSSDLYTINLATRQRTKLPAPINSIRWEWDRGSRTPSICSLGIRPRERCCSCTTGERRRSKRSRVVTSPTT